MKNEPTHVEHSGPASPPRHEFEHATPTVIHDPEQDMTLLAKWLNRAMLDPGRFWGWLGAGAVAVLGLVVMVNLFSSQGGSTSDVWAKLDAARNADDRLEVAKANPTSPAAPWATLEAASQLYNSGVSDLPNNSDTALQTLKKSLELYEGLAKSEPKDSPVAVIAALGVARSLEARNELPRAVDQYKHVAETWPEAPEAAEAKKLAAELQKPEAAAFYKELYAYKPTKVSLPPLGTEKLDFPPVIPAPTDAPAGADSLLIPPPPTTASPAVEAAKAEEAKPEAPKPEEPKAEETKPEAPKPEEPKAEPAPATPPAEAAPKPETAPATPPAEAPKPEAAPASPPAEAPKPEAAPASLPAEAPKPEVVPSTSPAEAPKPEAAPATPPAETPAAEPAKP